jgi:hypothetical protein
LPLSGDINIEKNRRFLKEPAATLLPRMSKKTFYQGWQLSRFVLRLKRSFKLRAKAPVSVGIILYGLINIPRGKIGQRVSVK